MAFKKIKTLVKNLPVAVLDGEAAGSPPLVYSIQSYYKI